jgi:hypothetical protein
MESHGSKPQDGEKAQMGKDGKWQLNVFDPDLNGSNSWNSSP